MARQLCCHYTSIFCYFSSICTGPPLPSLFLLQCTLGGQSAAVSVDRETLGMNQGLGLRNVATTDGQDTPLTSELLCRGNRTLCSEERIGTVLQQPVG